MGFLSIRHNDLIDEFHDFMDEVCIDVKKEPLLIPITGEQLKHQTANKSPNARVDLSARDFWTKGQRAYFDIRIFDPMAQSYKSYENLESIHKTHEVEKRRSYEERIININHGTFTPLVFTIMGGMSHGTRTMVSKLVDLLSIRRNQSRSVVMAWIRTKISFSLLRSANMCLRGTRKYKNRALSLAEIDIVNAVKESELQVHYS